MRKISVHLLLAIFFITLSFHFSYANEASSISPTLTETTSVAIVINQEGFFPRQVYIKKNQHLELFILSTLDGTFTLDQKSDPIKFKANTVQSVSLTDLSAETIKLQFISEKKEKYSGTLITSSPSENTPIDVVILGVKKKFLPLTTILPENTPFLLHTACTQSYPHSDFTLLGADISLIFKKNKITTVKVEKGLKSGTYLISRPKFPLQKHGITSKLVVLPTENTNFK